MLRIIQNTSAAGAKSYYSTADYYTEGQELAGVWRGRGAGRLGLFGSIAQPDWDALCDNQNPATGKTLTARQRQPRRVGYDFNFHVPKSVSLLYGLTQDPRLLEAFRESVRETMTEIEAEAQARVRKAGQNQDRTTANLLWGEFVHFTSRPVDGVPDPHLHAHCFVFNTTWDQEEQRWKAGQFAGLKRDAPYFQAVFHSLLAQKLGELGLASERTRGGWEVADIPATALAKFSRRTQQIEALAKAMGVTDALEKSELGAKTRERKQKHLSLTELQEQWTKRLTDGEREAIERVSQRLGGPALGLDPLAAAASAQRAAEHCFERKSVVPERELLTAAIQRGVGRASRRDVEAQVNRLPLISAQREGRRWVTTHAVLQEESRMVAFARDGRGTCRPLVAGSPALKRPWLNPGQQQAVRHVLSSTDRVILVRGAAGVGKTSMMQEAAEAIEAGGTKIVAFAPSAAASRGVLRQEGFATADTVSRLLVDPALQEQVRGQVLWVDEAGLLGTRTTARLFDLAQVLEARVVLSGDRRQHGSVERGAALRLLETEAGLMPAQIKAIQRQKGQYKQAVEALSEGRTQDGFAELEQLGWIRQAPEAERYAAMAGDYAAAVEAGKTALVVSPTHREGERVTAEIRHKLKALGRLGREERQVAVLRKANWTEAERSEAVHYQPGDVLEFHQNAKGRKKGQRLRVGEGPLPLDQANRFQVFHEAALTLSPGDLLRVTQNGKSLDGHALTNGAIYQLKGFTQDGDLRLANGWTVGREFGHLAYGYVVTSHASQGRTVDVCLIGQSAESFPASSREQFYVSVSRARERVVVYTDDKVALLEAVSRTEPRVTASELVSGRGYEQTANRQPSATREASARAELGVPQRGSTLPDRPYRQRVMAMQQREAMAKQRSQPVAMPQRQPPLRQPLERQREAMAYER